MLLFLHDDILFRMHFIITIISRGSNLSRHHSQKSQIQRRDQSEHILIIMARMCNLAVQNSFNK